MSTITAVAPRYATAAQDPAASAGTVAGPQTLGQDDFLKLLAQQFQSQDPMKPMEDTSFIAQMAQFTSLQQSSAMAKDISALRADQLQVTANSYLGHRVTVDAGNGTTAYGDVTAIDNSGDAPQLIVNGTAYSLSAVLRVEPSGVSTVPTTTTGN
jgi:flagellar basal-body rod modification protein FlgD